MTQALSQSRYSWGADEHLTVQFAEGMSLGANLTAMAVARRVEEAGLDGVSDICPSNASLLVKFNPDIVAPAVVESTVRQAEAAVAATPHLSLPTRILEIPVWYDDPFTNETASRFRDRHQRPEGNDLEFAAIENGMNSTQEFIDAHCGTPWITSMVGFVAGLPFLFQMTPPERQLELPKYLRPRTDTPKQTIGHGGCFSCVYSVRGAGGYQMFGITPTPIFDPDQRLAHFADFMILFRPGDIVKFRSIDEAEYYSIQAEVEAGTYQLRQRPVTFTLDDFTADPDAFNNSLLGELYDN
ncbi:MAG: carboxyltransferase domain-containing protein [Propionicimonas sp.]|jgi:urea carboxylase